MVAWFFLYEFSQCKQVILAYYAISLSSAYWNWTVIVYFDPHWDADITLNFMTSIFLSSLLAYCWSSLLCPARHSAPQLLVKYVDCLKIWVPQSLSVSTQLNIFLKLTYHGLPPCQKVLPTLYLQLTRFKLHRIYKVLFPRLCHCFWFSWYRKPCFLQRMNFATPTVDVHTLPPFFSNKKKKKFNKRYCCFVFYQMACCLPFIENITQLAVLF